MKRFLPFVLLSALLVGCPAPSHRQAEAQAPAVVKQSLTAPAKPRADEPIASIQGPTQTSGTFLLIVKANPAAKLTWSNVLPEGAIPPLELELKNGDTVLLHQSPVAGVYLFRLRAQVPSEGLDPIADVEHTVTVGTPVPPNPPEPPTPEPVVPVPGEGFRVLFLEESSQRNPLMVSVVRHPEVESYLNIKCVKEGGHPEWRTFDKDDDQKRTMPANWKLAHGVAKRDAAGKFPWVIVSNGKTGISCPLPATKDELLALLRKYGG